MPSVDRPPPRVEVGLPFSELTYDNTGAPTRLNVSVIGASVSLTAWAEGLRGPLGEDVLATAALAARAPGSTLLGPHAVKGVPEPVAVYRRGRAPPAHLAT